MIADSSPLKSLPSNVPLKEALFLDGLRHAAEIAFHAYSHLQVLLYEISKSEKSQALIAPAYLNAWSCIDSMERFRSLISQYPKNGLLSGHAMRGKYLEAFAPVREIRNVADHVANRIDHLVSRKATVLGEMHWLSETPESPYQFMIGVIRPGFIGGTVTQNFQIPYAYTKVKRPSGHIRLSAGDKTVNICEAVQALEDFLTEIEKELVQKYSELGTAYETQGSDMIILSVLNIKKPN